MTHFTKTALCALALSLTALPSSSGQVELVTAIGFGNTKVHATQNAVRGWILEASRIYGGADWNTALRGQLDCFKQDASGGYGTSSIVVEGDASAPWSCSVSGIPLSAVQG